MWGGASWGRSREAESRVELAVPGHFILWDLMVSVADLSCMLGQAPGHRGEGIPPPAHRSSKNKGPSPDQDKVPMGLCRGLSPTLLPALVSMPRIQVSGQCFSNDKINTTQHNTTTIMIKIKSHFFSFCPRD